MIFLECFSFQSSHWLAVQCICFHVSADSSLSTERMWRKKKKKKKKRKEKKRKKRYSRYSVCSVVRSLQDHRSLMCISNSYIYLTRFTASPLCAHLALGMMDFLQAELFKWRRTKRVVTRRERNRLDEHPYLRVVDDVGENINSLRLLIESQEFYIENLKGGKKTPKCLFKFWWEDEQQNWRFFLYKISILDDASFSFKQL